jgi:hypothetical protein
MFSRAVYFAVNAIKLPHVKLAPVGPMVFLLSFGAVKLPASPPVPKSHKISDCYALLHSVHSAAG